MPTYNSENYLEETLAALMAQKYTDFEVVISDNASTDGTLEIAKAYCASDERFRLIQQPVNIGSPGNYNALLAEAKGDYFMWNASDDRALPLHTLRCVQALDAHPCATAAFSRVVYIDANGDRIGEMSDAGLDFMARKPGERADLFLRRSVFQAIGFGSVIRTPHLRSMGGLPMYYSGDIDLGLRMALSGPWYQVDEQLYETRRHASQGSKLRTASLEAMYEFIDPKLRKIYGFPEWDLARRMIAGTVHSPAELRDRVRTLRAIAALWAVPHWRLYLFDFKRNFATLFRRHQ